MKLNKKCLNGLNFTRMIPPVKSKLPNAGTTIFTIMSGLATEYNAVNLGQGFPDFPMSEELTGLVSGAMKKNFNQ